MSTDLDIIKQLEQTIGIKLEKLDKIWTFSVGYMQNERNQITGLSLSECDLKEFPPLILKLQNLTELSLINNKLGELPPSIIELQNLTELDLVSNQLSNLPPSI